MRRLVVLSVALLLSAGGAASGGSPDTRGGDVEVVVGLAQPSLARAIRQDRALASTATRGHRLDLRAPAAVSYVRALASAQRALAARVTAAIPQARVHWRYQVVADAIAVVVPRSEAALLARVPGVARVYPTLTYHALLDRSPELIGAPALWGASLESAGEGVKIGIIDEGVDQTHPFFDPTGYTVPPGYPKGDTRYTTAKVIVARAFPAPGTKWKYAGLPFDPVNSEHGTHVAGIAAGDHGVYTGRALSGVAPKAYIGNYKALTVPTPQFGLDGNSPEIAAAIEAAVRDGMDVINLSLGEPEVDPGRDLVVEAIDGAADAGVVPVVAAGNDFEEFGLGSIGSPANAPKAITVAAVSNGRGYVADGIADFSSSGPTPISLQLKPDVSSPGVNVLSSLPRREGLWGTLSGTSMATPGIAGSVALLKERHPDWTVAELKSALTQTGDPVHPLGSTGGEVASTREGGGLVNLPRANAPLLFASPSTLSFGLLRAGATAARTISLSDADGGAGVWTVSVQAQGAAPAGSLATPSTVTVPGSLVVTATASDRDGDVTGFVVLSRGADVRRIPFWLRAERPQLGSEPTTPLRRAGVYEWNTAGKPSLVSSYRYPEPPDATPLSGPEQVFRVHIERPVANFAVAVLSGTATPRVVFAGDENHLVGYTALPLDLNPYRSSFGVSTPIAGVVLPAPGDYDVVFDTPSGKRPGPFTFRFWIGDTTPPALRLLPRPATATTLRVAASDAGSGVDPKAITVTLDGAPAAMTFSDGVIRIGVRGLSPGRHKLSVTVSDRQEAKNMEDVGPILPNTRTLTTSFVLR